MGKELEKSIESKEKDPISIKVKIKPEELGLVKEVDEAIDSIVVDETKQRKEEIKDHSAILDAEARPELINLFNNIFVQYIDTIRYCIHNILHGHYSAVIINSFLGTLEPLVDATREIGHIKMHSLLSNFKNYLLEISKVPGKIPGKIRRFFSRDFEKLVSILPPEFQEKHFADFRYVKYSNPLIEEIRKIKYIGPKKIQRLWSAGLVSIDIYLNARPKEITEVTGIGEELVVKIIKVAKDFKIASEKKRIEDLKRMIASLENELISLSPSESLNLFREIYLPLQNLREAIELKCPFIAQKIEQTKAEGKK